uniref:Uncharacterized protein n=1 Tax=Tetradesmus obliquus TaxID=3088 RepID=A0A383WI25_TETOB|eukprot:jgi/Sobl393_1/2511/SZX76893.1
MSGRTPLHLAAKLGFASVVQLLLNAGASVSTVMTAADVAGRSPLSWALQERHFDTAARLVRAMKPAHADVARKVLDQFPQQLASVGMACVELADSVQAQAQQQQEQLDRDRQQLAAERAAAQELLVAACLGMRSAQAAERRVADRVKQKLKLKFLVGVIVCLPLLRKVHCVV